MLRRRDLRRISRGLRFRLTATSALFFAILLIGFAVYYRETLAAALRRQARDTLGEQWSGMKGYLRISKEHEADPDDHYKAWWYFDEEDPDENRYVVNMRGVYLVADASGKPILAGADDQPAVSPTYKTIGVDAKLIQDRVKDALAKPKPFWDERQNADGEKYLLRSGVVWDEKHKQPFYVSLGLELDSYDNILGHVTWIYVGAIPASLILGGLLGWFMSGRALEPVLEVAQAAQRISGSNLSLRIPTRRAGDELDYLILTFNRMIDRLESSFQQIKQFSTDVSHELRTPITAIRGQLEVALFTAETTEQYREAMFNALQDIDKLSSIVRALLLLSQAESGQLVLQKSRINLSELANEIVEQFQILAEEAGVRLSAEVPPECLAEVDRVQIERMLTNLLSNAIKFTPKGGRVRVAVEPGPDFLEMVIEDTGCGIPTESLPHIFDRFYRVTSPGGAPAPNQGLGLGLSFVAWIVKAHDGKIHVDSTPGQGTKFTVRLPATGVAAEPIAAVGQPVA